MDVSRWVKEYERTWRERDVDALDGLFTPDAVYLRSAYDEGLVGLAAIRGFWVEEEPFTMSSSVVAVDGATAVVRVEVHYLGDRPHEYRDLWILDFAADGRVRRFEEWAHWPGMGGGSPQD